MNNTPEARALRPVLQADLEKWLLECLTVSDLQPPADATPLPADHQVEYDHTIRTAAAMRFALQHPHTPYLPNLMVTTRLLRALRAHQHPLALPLTNLSAAMYAAEPHIRKF